MALEINAGYVLIALAVGVFANIIRGVVGWLNSGEAFEARKFSATLLTGAIIGVGAGILAVPAIVAAQDQVALIVAFVGIFTGAIAVDVLRKDGSGAILNNVKESNPTS